MSVAGKIITLIFVVITALILDWYIVTRWKKSRALRKAREQTGEPVPGKQMLKDWRSATRSFLGELWQNLWRTEQRAAQVLLAIAAVCASAFIGFAHAQEIAITLVPILLWLLAISVCFVMFYPAGQKGGFRYSRTWLGLSFLLAAAFALRVAALGDFPPGFHTDEAGTANFVQRHVLNPLNDGKTLNPFIVDTNGQPAVYDYFFRFSLTLFGFSLAGARMSSALVGTLAVGGVFFMMNEAAGRRMAWLSAILMTVYHYHIHWSRIALNNIWVTLLLPLTFGFFLRGWKKGWTGGAVLAGLFLGLTAYSYAGGYIVLILLPVLIWQAWNKTSRRQELALYTGKMTALALVIAAPLIVYALRFPERFLQRSRQIFGWNSQSIQSTVGDAAAYWDFFVHQTGRAFGAFNYYSDITGFYRPGIPFLVGFASVLFVWGVALALYKKQSFPLAWIAIVSILGGVMIFGTPSSSHYIGSIPAICWLVAMPLNWLIENGRSRLAYILLALIILTDLVFYFLIYAANPSPDLVLQFPMVEPYIH